MQINKKYESNKIKKNNTNKSNLRRSNSSISDRKTRIRKSVSVQFMNKKNKIFNKIQGQILKDKQESNIQEQNNKINNFHKYVDEEKSRMPSAKSNNKIKEVIQQGSNQAEIVIKNDSNVLQQQEAGSKIFKISKGSKEQNLEDAINSQKPKTSNMKFRKKDSVSQSKSSLAYDKQSHSISNSHISSRKNIKLSGYKKKEVEPILLNIDYSKSVPQQIEQYISRRKDVEIIQYFYEYKKQFQTKSKMLHQYLYEAEQPQKIKNTYLNESDTHFINGIEGIMLKLFRNGIIVSGSYDNLREEAIEQIQKWVIGWIHRKINYGTLVEEEQNQNVTVDQVLKQLEIYQRNIDTENTSF